MAEEQTDLRPERGLAFGVFDLLHVGHVRYLKYAKSLCHSLWVGIRSDHLITPGKPSLPVILEKQRFELVSALACVDHAFIFETSLDVAEYWLQWFQEHHVTLVVVGGDWKNSERWLFLQPLLEKSNIQVCYAPRTPNISTRQICAQIKVMD